MKYNDNGEYKDIYVKAFDTLPVGTEVDYDGNVVPSGWTEVNNILYEDNTGTNGNIILNDDVSNYDYLEIICKRSQSLTASGYRVLKVPVSQNIALSYSYLGASNIVDFITTYSLSGTSMDIAYNSVRQTVIATGVVTLDNSNGIYITKIIGIKE